MIYKASNSTATKTYTLTNQQPNKPYLNISGSYLPLTTATKSGLKLKVQSGNNTYRPLEYGSASESNTFYTTAADSVGLSSTTALTRASTSATSYLTRASTSDTKYGTRASTSDTKYGTRASTSTTIYQTRASTSGTTYYTRASTSGQQILTEYTSSTRSSLLSYKFNFNGLSITQNNTRSSTAINSYSATLYISDIVGGIIFNASDMRNNNFQKITYRTSYSRRGGTAYSVGGYTEIYPGHKSSTLTPGLYQMEQIYSSAAASGRQYTTSFPNLMYNKYFPWDSGPYTGTASYIVRSYKLNKINNTLAYGQAMPLLTWSTYGASRSYSTATYYQGYELTALHYYESILPTTRVSYLTRASTSDTKYGTRASTSNTVYGTRTSTSGTTYLTRASTSGTTYLTRASTSGTAYGTRESISGYSGVSSSSSSVTTWE